MIKTKRINQAVNVFLILMLATLSLYFFADKKERAEHNVFGGLLNYGTEVRNLKQVFESKGSEEAVVFFKNEYERYENSAIHSLEHFLGAELYLREGLKGLNLCVDSIHAGCYHGFFIEAFRGEGLDFVGRTVEECNSKETLQKRSACLHGVGHGIFVLEGQNNIDAALAQCEKDNKAGLAAEMCYTGVFMEYDFPSQHNDINNPKVLARKLNGENYMSLCPEISEKYRTWCFFELPMWWDALFLDSPDKFDKIMGLCSRISDEKDLRACFERVGTIVATEPGFDEKSSQRQCDRAKNETQAIYCYEGIAKSNAMANLKIPTYLCGKGSPSNIRCEIKIKEAFNEVHD